MLDQGRNDVAFLALAGADDAGDFGMRLLSSAGRGFEDSAGFGRRIAEPPLYLPAT